MSNQNAKKSTGIEFTLFNSTTEIGMDNFGYLNSALYLLLFCNKPAKKIYGVRTLTVEPPQFPQYEPVRFLLDCPSPSKCKYYTNDLRRENSLIILHVVLIKLLGLYKQ